MSRVRELLLGQTGVELDSVRARFFRVAPSSLDIEIVSYIFARDWPAFLEVQEGLLLRIMEMSKRWERRSRSRRRPCTWPTTASRRECRTRSTQRQVYEFEPDNARLASAAPSDNARNFAQAICGCVRPPNPQSVPAITCSGPTSLANR